VIVPREAHAVNGSNSGGDWPNFERLINRDFPDELQPTTIADLFCNSPTVSEINKLILDSK